jgi:hypothetical protein
MGNDNFKEYLSDQIEEGYEIQVKIMDVLEEKKKLGIETFCTGFMSCFADPERGKIILAELEKL